MSRYGVREICDVTFKALTSVDIGNQHFDAGQPVLVLDTAKTSSLEGAATTVYAQGGKGNPRLIGWDGEKTLTFTVEDALISPESFAMLSGAGVIRGAGNSDDMTDEKPKVYVHTTYDLVIEGSTGNYYAKLPQEIRDGATLVVSKEAPIYAITLDNAGAPKHFLSAISQDEIYTDAGLSTQVTIGDRGVVDIAKDADIFFKISVSDPLEIYTDQEVVAGDSVKIDCYTVHGAGATELQIDAESFAGYYYIEADTLFREEATGQDLPAQFVIPRGKIQSNFTFTMANSGDPSTFTFTIDCFPAYTKFNKTKKVMASLQILDPTDVKHNYANKEVIGHKERTADDDEYFTGLYDASIFDVPGQSGGSSEADAEAAAAVSEMPVTTDAEKLAALQAYNKLSAAQKALVSREVREAIGELTEEEISADTVQAVIDAANDLGDTPLQSEIMAILKAYAALTDEQEAQALAGMSDEAKEKLGL